MSHTKVFEDLVRRGVLPIGQLKALDKPIKEGHGGRSVVTGLRAPWGSVRPDAIPEPRNGC